MASVVDDRDQKSNLLSVSTQPFVNTPGSEKTLDEAMELRRPSTVSTPYSVHSPNGFETDVEAMMPARSSDHLNKTNTPNPRACKGDNEVWPGQAHWKRKARIAKKNNRSCNCFARFTPQTRIAIKVAIALLIVGIAVGVGFGVSKSLGAGVWHASDNPTT
ncbi:hypothetical protein F4780DRAFT_599555 [Xylariomycetidae sp. FL0641]|nr:hypothetical protein F4780DRAFT_599555 [Xylariomycetidae sp. FL0641]